MVLTRNASRNARGDEPSPQVAGPSGRQPPASPRSRRRAARIPVLIRPRHSDSSSTRSSPPRSRTRPSSARQGSRSRSRTPDGSRSPSSCALKKS